MKKIILDCDPGMDDSMAIVMAVKSPDLDLLAVTTVNGNYPVDVTCVNARKVLVLPFYVSHYILLCRFRSMDILLYTCSFFLPYFCFLLFYLFLLSFTNFFIALPTFRVFKRSNVGYYRV